MAATVLKSERAIHMSIFVVRASVRMRKLLSANHEILAKLAELERHVESHDGDIEQLLHAIRGLMAPSPANRRRIGFELPDNVQARRRLGIAV